MNTDSSPSPIELARRADELGKYAFLVDCDACKASIPFVENDPAWHVSAQGWCESPMPCASYVIGTALPALARAVLEAEDRIAVLEKTFVEEVASYPCFYRGLKGPERPCSTKIYGDRCLPCKMYSVADYALSQRRSAAAPSVSSSARP